MRGVIAALALVIALVFGAFLREYQEATRWRSYAQAATQEIRQADSSSLAAHQSEDEARKDLQILQVQFDRMYKANEETNKDFNALWFQFQRLNDASLALVKIDQDHQRMLGDCVEQLTTKGR